MKSPLDSLLNLPGITVEGLVQLEGYVCLQVKSLEARINCPCCQKPNQELHHVRSLLVRDLPTFGKPVYLRVAMRSFYCRLCQKYSLEKLEFIDGQQLHTNRYKENIYQRVRNASVEQIAREEDLNSAEVKEIFDSVKRQAKKKLFLLKPTEF